MRRNISNEKIGKNMHCFTFTFSAMGLYMTTCMANGLKHGAPIGGTSIKHGEL
jgi:hypothetical protein